MFTNNPAGRVRILHIVGDSRFGGAAPIILGLAQVAQSEGWQVDILTTDPVFQQAAAKMGFGVVVLDVIRREIRPAWDLRGLLRLIRFLRQQRYDMVHTHTSKGGFVGRLAARFARVPAIVHTVHGFAFHEASPARVRLFYSALETFASRWCDRIVSVSEFHREWAIRLRICGQSKIIAIPNGIAELRRNPDGDPEAIRRTAGARPGDLLIMTVARLVPDKGLEYLIESAAMLSQTERRIHLAIAGDGPARRRLEELASERGVSDRVRFLGFRRDVGDLLAAADLIALPSLREGLSISLLEAMAAGKAIVATSIGGHREVVSRGDVVWLVPPANAEALRDGIVRLAEDPAIMARLGKNARAAYEDYYTEDRMLQSYKHLYFHLLGRDSRAGHEPGIVRPATRDDLAGIVEIHQKAFSHYFLTRLGRKFLRRYYNLVLNYRSGILLVSEGEDGLQGFACGFVSPAEFYKFMWRARMTFALSLLFALVRHPSLIGKVISGVRRVQATALEWPERSCELSSIAVAPRDGGNGFGKTLIEAFLDKAKSMEAHCVYLTTDADGNDAVNAFYRNAGFEHTRCFLQGGARWMNEYVINGWEARNRCRTLV
jgi:glycosyltransferase involved in cell wall biosynthesis/ribosomal protein S18 acetylase RimI-like enzyme